MNSSSSESSFSASQSSSQKPTTNKRKAKMKGKQEKLTEQSIVSCKFCLGKKLKLKSLKPHVKAYHPSLYESSLPSYAYVAKRRQKTPEDPKFQFQKSEEEQTPEKKTRTKTNQDSQPQTYSPMSNTDNIRNMSVIAHTDQGESKATEDQSKLERCNNYQDKFDAILKAEPEEGLSQDEFYWLGKLTDNLESGLLQKSLGYFSTFKARLANSPARKLIESAADNMGNFFECNDLKHVAYVYTASLLLGDVTLKIFIGKFSQFPSQKIKSTRHEFARVLQKHCGLNEIFSEWLSKNLDRLTDQSLPFLSDISDKFEGEIRFSTVVAFQEKEIAKFQNVCGIYNKAMSVPKRTIIEGAIDRTLIATEDALNVEQFKKVVKHVLTTETKILRTSHLGAVASICQWPKIIDLNQKSDQLLDESTYQAAAFSICELNPNEFDFYEQDSARLARLTLQACQDIDLSINNIQLATAALLGLNSQRERLQCCQVPAGQGKSRIESSLAMMILFENLDHDVYMVYPHDGLLQRDKREYESLLSYLETFDSKALNRLHYQVGLQGLQTKRKKAVIILDESDHLVFENLEFFYKLTQKKQFKFICFSATVSDSNEQGSESQVLKEMNFKIFKNMDLKPFVPKIDLTCQIGNLEGYRMLIDAQRKLRSVLIYSGGTLHQELLSLEFVSAVTPETPDSDLRSLGKKKGEHYPVLLFDQFYGGRGLDYRSFENDEGLCLIIGAPCADQRTRDQILARVGRMGEKSYRIQDSAFEPIDKKMNAGTKGTIGRVLQNIKTGKKQNPKPAQSQTEKEDKQGWYEYSHPQNKKSQQQAYEHQQEKRDQAALKGGTESEHHNQLYLNRQDEYGNDLNQASFKTSNHQ